MALVQFAHWSLEAIHRLPVSINPARVESVEEYCGVLLPGSKVMLISKETFVVMGTVEQITEALNQAEKIK